MGEEFTELPEAGPQPGRRPTAEQLDAHWLKHTYRGDMPQLTWRAMLMGALLGGEIGRASCRERV